MDKTTTFSHKESKDLRVFTVKQMILLIILGIMAGITLQVLIYSASRIYPEAFMTMQGSVYYTSEDKGVTVTYWRNGKPIGDLDHVQSAVCRNLCEADSITIKTPWP